MGIRRKARIVALQALFEVDSVAHDPEETVDRLIEEAALAEEGGLFARELVGGVLANKERIDSTIQNYAPAWPVAQLAAIDRNILRLAIFEILLNKVPVKAAINEAVELAKTFGSENSARFINGVLGTLVAN
ncbi:MAG: transcription antitermination factor NusB [Dehalococcoidia bacterium]|nr:transcription antitermination factor NusB [Dehalococcoidia bacterium]